MTFFKSRFQTAIAAGVLLSFGGPAGATDPLWLNQTYYYGPPPQIDATAFSNEGELRFFLQPPAAGFLQVFPFETLNTLYYTNRGVLFSPLGIRFDNHDQGYERRPAAVFQNSGQLVGEDLVDTATGNARSIMEITATNLINRGLLETGESGRMGLKARNLDLFRSGLRVAQSARGELDPVVYGDQVDVFNNQYRNAPNVTDFYWNVGSNLVSLTRGSPTGIGLYQPNTFWSPQHVVITNNSGGDIAVSLPGPNIEQSGNYYWETPRLATYQAFTYTNSIGTSNRIISSVFVPTTMRGGQITAEVGFWRLASGASTNLVALAAGHPMVRINVRLADPILGNLNNAIYVYDYSLLRTNAVVLGTNVFQPTFRPMPISVRRAPDQQGYWTNRSLANTVYNYPQHTYSGSYSNQNVGMTFSAYAAAINEASGAIITNLFNLAIPESGVVNTNPYAPLALFDPTNRPGRLELSSDAQIDLRRTKLYSANYLKLAAPHVVHDDQTVLDAPYMSLTFGSTNGTLNVDNLVPDTVERLEGRLFIHSGVWSNSLTVGTNLVSTIHHFLVVDPEDLVTTKDVTMFETDLRADNLIIGDRVRSTRRLLLDATNIVLNLGGALQPTLETKDLGAANLPRLVTFTNNSTNSIIQGLSSFGLAPAARLKSWHNGRRWLGFAHRVNAESLRNQGQIIASRGVTELTADVLDLRGGTVSSQLDNRLKARELFVAGSALTSGGFLNYTQFTVNVPGGLSLDVTDLIDDGGPSQNNLWQVSGGLSVVRKPVQGDLLGTRITSTGKFFEIVSHTWAGEDRGPSVSGYSNNMALQRLTLDGETFTLFTFAPATGNNALYVEYLELRNGAQNFASNIEIQPGMRVYFGGSNLDPALLDGELDGRLVYLPNSAAATVQLAGESGPVEYRVELVASMTVDSDGDGIVNGLDESPFDGVRIFVESVAGNSQPASMIWWNAAPRTEYAIQFKDGLDEDWQHLKRVTTGPESGVVGALDSAAGANRFYRVNYAP